jgi:CheY-like chemotaxis protein
MKKLATTSSSKQIPSYLGLTPKVQESGVELATHIFRQPFASSSNMETPTYLPNGRVLVVDDNAHALHAMSELLKFEGFSVLTAQNGLDALNKMRTA